ncbi:hypothetical protein Tco_0071553 [Tanacetum coccineum]
MTKVIKGEFEKLEDLKVKDVSLTYDASLEVFNNEFNRLSRMEDDLFTYEVEIANIPCDSNKDDDSEQRVSHEAGDDIGYDPFDVAFTEWINNNNDNNMQRNINKKMSTTRAKIDVYERKITLRVGEERIIFKSVKPASSFIKRVYMLSLREKMELDLEARLMGETLVLNRSLDPLNGDYTELNDLNVPIELWRDQADDLMPTIEEDKLEYMGNNVVGALMNVPIFVGTFSVTTDFAVLENMDDYRDEGMGDVIFGELFLKEVGINASGPRERITTDIGGEFTNLEILKCWSLETSRRLSNIRILAQ